ncbi:Uncharacterised protein [Vibrio cholerae]|nr:Uncharacterised protein [Vibrio cholerae]CSI47743.1 Uncharacterised protein [Vibrio cholerae]
MHAIFRAKRHVIAQVVKTKFVVGAVQDVGLVSLFFSRLRHVGNIHTHGHA